MFRNSDIKLFSGNGGVKNGFENRNIFPIFAPAKAKYGSLGEWLKPPVC